jgi:hypothetical protein
LHALKGGTPAVGEIDEPTAFQHDAQLLAAFAGIEGDAFLISPSAAAASLPAFTARGAIATAAPNFKRSRLEFSMVSSSRERFPDWLLFSYEPPPRRFRWALAAF